MALSKQPLKSKTIAEEQVVSDMTGWDIAKTVVSWAWMPLYFYLPFKNNKNNRDADWKEKIEQRLSTMESDSRIHDVQLKVVQSSIEEIKTGINKLIDRLLK